MWIIDNWDLIMAIVVGVIGVVKATKWGKANARVLEKLVRAVEYSSTTEGVKKNMRVEEAGMKPVEQAVLQSVVSNVDPKKESVRKKRAVEVVKNVVKGLMVLVIMSGCITEPSGVKKIDPVALEMSIRLGIEGTQQLYAMYLEGQERSAERDALEHKRYKERMEFWFSMLERAEKLSHDGTKSVP